MADSLSIAQYATESNSLTAQSGVYCAYTTDGTHWFTLRDDKALFDGYTVAMWQSNGEWKTIPSQRPVINKYKKFITRHLTQAKAFLEGSSPIIMYKETDTNDGVVLRGVPAIMRMKEIFALAGKLQNRIPLAQKYLEDNTYISPLEVFNYDKENNITGISIPKEILLDYFLRSNAMASILEIDCYFLPRYGSNS